MRIILTVNYSPWSFYSGGGQRSTHYLALHFAKRGHDVHVIYSRSPFEKVPVPGHLPYQIHWATLYSYKSSRKILFRPLTSYSVRRILKKLCQSAGESVIVHANGEEAASVYKLKNRFRFGFVATPRYSGYPATLLAGRSLSIKEKFLLFLYDWKYLHQMDVLKTADRICPPSHWAASEIKKLHPSITGKITVVYNGAPDEFTQVRRSVKQEGTILFFGRLTHDKGVDLLLKAYKEVRDPKPDLVIAGKGEEKEKLVQLGRKLGIHSRIRYLPWLSHQELAKELAGTRICVLPSRHENYSLALLSSLAAGVPVISTNKGGTPEMIKDGVTGLLADPENIESLAHAINSLLADSSLAERLGANARQDVLLHKTWDRSCEKLEKIYRRILSDFEKC